MVEKYPRTAVDILSFPTQTEQISAHFFYLGMQIDEKMSMDGMHHRVALVAVRVERLIKMHGSMDLAMFFILDKCPTQSQVGKH